MNFDGERVEPTARFIDAVHEVLAAQMEMMRTDRPDCSDCWAWGVVTIKDAADRNYMEFSFGDEITRPAFLQNDEDTAVVIRDDDEDVIHYRQVAEDQKER